MMMFRVLVMHLLEDVGYAENFLRIDLLEAGFVANMSANREMIWA